MNASRNKRTLPMRKEINKKSIKIFGDEKYLREVEYLYQNINGINPPEISQRFIDILFYISDEVNKVYDTGEIKSKGRTSF